jgi:adenine-specific DNA-methyltransferase
MSILICTNKKVCYHFGVDRNADFEAIKNSVLSYVQVSTSKALLLQGDALDLLKLLPKHCVSLILTDPPYHATKKENIYGDTSFKEDQNYLEWMAKFAIEWHRILKPNGSLFCFSSPAMAAQMEVMFSENFNILAQIVWTKPNDPGFDGWKQKMKKTALRQWYAHTERIIFGEPAYEGNLFRSYFGNFLREMRKKAGMTAKQLAEITGAYGRVNHGGAISNWEAGRNVPSPNQYEKICKALIKTGKVESMPSYEDVIRPFRMDASKEFTDVWNFPSVRPYEGKHPAEKPVAMLEHAIEATTNPGDIVLDCFSGSGSTAVAALKLGRRVVAMEIVPLWVSRIAKLLEFEANKGQWNTPNFETSRAKKRKTPQPTLFSESK